MDNAIGLHFTPRVVIQRRCQTEHQRLISQFMTDQELADKATLEGIKKCEEVADTGHNALNFMTNHYGCLQIQL